MQQNSKTLNGNDSRGSRSEWKNYNHIMQWKWKFERISIFTHQIDENLHIFNRMVGAIILTRNFFFLNGLVHFENWPSQSPDLNIIENC